MKTGDFNSALTSKVLNEQMYKAFGVRVNFEKYDRAQLENYRNVLRTDIHQMENTSGFNELLANESYQKNKHLLELLNTRIKEMLGEAAKKKMVNEKAKSEKQRKAAGVALAAKRAGKKPKGKGAASQMSKMSTKELKKFAGTKHKGLPVKKKKKVSETNDIDIRRTSQDFSDIIDSRTLNYLLDQEAEPVSSRGDLKPVRPGPADTTPGPNFPTKLRGEHPGKIMGLKGNRVQGANDASNDQEMEESLKTKMVAAALGGITALGGMGASDAQTNPGTNRSTEFRIDPTRSNRVTLNPPGAPDIVVNPPGIVKKAVNPPGAPDIVVNPPGTDKKAVKAKGAPNIVVNPPGTDRVSIDTVVNTKDGIKKTNEGKKSKKKPMSKGKPDFLDFDRDGNKKETMKKALADKKKKKGFPPAKKATKKTVKKKSKTNEAQLRNNFRMILEGIRYYIAEDEEGKAMDITAGADMVKDFTSWMQRLGQYQTKSTIELADSIRSNFGPQEAEQFKTTVTPAIQSSLEALTASREIITKAVSVLAGEEQPDAMMGQPGGEEEPPMEEPVGDSMNVPPEEGGDEEEEAEVSGGEDQFAASDAASAGRELRESRRQYKLRKLHEANSIMRRLAG